jgi:hypothetical protein
MHSFLRQALMRYHNEFFTMTEEEQTLFKLQDHDELDKKIRLFIEDKIGMPHGDYEATAEQVLEYNKINLPYIGIGPNSFMLNEFHWNEEILRFKNLYEANADDHDFQEQAMIDDFDKDYVKKPLYNRINQWARAFVDGEFYYLSLNNYAMWLFYDMDRITFEWLDENIPYDYVSGKDDGKEVDGGYLWDKELDANGQEGWHQHMSDFSRDWTRNQYDADLNDADRFGDYVYMVDRDDSDPTDPSLTYIFGSLEVLRKITYYDFVNDCEKVKGDPAELLELRDARRVEYRSALNDEFERIKKTKPPGLVEERKTRDVVIAEGALDSLEE